MSEPRAHVRIAPGEHLRVRSADGTVLFAEAVGRGPAMLLCNGLYCSTHYWPRFVEHFSQTHTVVTFDYRGHGRSAPAPDPEHTDLQTLTHDALAVLDAVTEGPVIVVGHSMGVRIALELAVRRAARVTANVLVCGNAWMLGNSPLERALETVAAGTLRTAGRLGKLTRVLRHLGTEPAMFFTAASLLGGVGRSTPREPVDALIANVRQLDVRLMAALARGYLAHDGRALLSRVTQPTLQVIGGLDRLAPPEHAARIAELLVDVQTTVLPRCTHLAPVEDPLEVHRAVRAFLRPAS